MSLQAFTLVLIAAVLHAGWNTVMKASDDRIVSVWAITTAGALAGVPVLALGGPPDRRALPMLIGSIAIHLVYAFVLAKAYERADLSVAYPIARGTAPLLVTVFGVVFLADEISKLGVAGVVLITVGLGLLAGGGRVLSGVGWAGLTGVTIASYSIVDGVGVRAGGESIRYIATLMIGQAIVLGAVLLVGRGPRLMAAAVAAQPARLVVGGVASAVAYLLVMVAARTEALGLVIGLRETSAVFGFLLGRHLLAETPTAVQGGAVGLATAGAVTIAVAA